jgi:hypothetical protein
LGLRITEISRAREPSASDRKIRPDALPLSERKRDKLVSLHISLISCELPPADGLSLIEGHYIASKVHHTNR